MQRNGWAAAVAVTISLFAGGSGRAQVCRPPEPFGVDPVNGNFSPISWPDGSFNWVNNAMGADLLGVWANTDFDMWFVGSATRYFLGPSAPPVAVHFDGFSLQPVRVPGTGVLYGVWGSASNDVWAVGDGGMIVHWDGTGWVTVPSGTSEFLYAVNGTASDDVWAASGRVMLHWDGTSWTNSPGFVPDGAYFAGLAAISRSDALVATGFGCQRWDGGSWNATPCGVQGGSGIYAAASNDIWVVGFINLRENLVGYRSHWDGSSWTPTAVQNRAFRSIAGTGPTDIWINGQLHYDGSNWTDNSCGPEFASMSVSNNGAFMGVNPSGIEYFSGDDGWPFLARTDVNWAALGGRDPANLWAVGANGEVIAYDGSGWSGRNYPFPSEGFFLDRAFGGSSSDIWALALRCYGCESRLRHFDGGSWTDVDSPLDSGFVAGFVREPNDAIAVDANHRAWHWDGSRWFQITLPIFENDLIVAFWGTAPDDVWAVGGTSGGSEGTGSIYHWDGNSWQRIYRTPVGFGVVNHVAGTARDDVWFSVYRTSGDVLLHWDGSSIVERQILNRHVYGIAADSSNDVWFQDGFESFTHYDGASWTREQVNIGINLDQLLGVPGAGVFALGDGGQIYQRR
jgi:hypothetical protein